MYIYCFRREKARDRQSLACRLDHWREQRVVEKEEAAVDHEQAMEDLDLRRQVSISSRSGDDGE